MSSFALPRIPAIRPGSTPQMTPKVSITDQGLSMVNLTLQGYLRRVKAEIDTRQEEWDRFKKCTNPCEYVHTPVPGGKQAVCRMRPLSRSFYKMIELLHNHAIAEDLPHSATSFHFAEGPGGFIEAFIHHRGNVEADKCYGMTLISDSDAAVPGWKKSRAFLLRHPNVEILRGKDGTGDLFSAENLKHCLEVHGKTADFVTGDGGFDFSLDFNRQEASSMRLILAQIMFAIAVQKPGGAFILKVFDTFSQASMDILYLLSSLYQNVQATKPSTSRQANSEKYIICKGFHCRCTQDICQQLCNTVQSMETHPYLLRLFPAPLPYYFVTKIEELNAVLGQQQIESIATTLTLMETTKHDRLETLRKNNIQKCIGWCQRHRLPYNRSVSSTNIFLSGRNSPNSPVSPEC